MFVYRLELDPEESKAIKERIGVAVEYMQGLKQEIEKAKPKLLLG
jgi:hypothetical protein